MTAVLPLPQERPTLSIEEAAGFLGISRKRAYASAHRGEIPTVSFGRALRVPTAALRRMLEVDLPERDESGAINPAPVQAVPQATERRRAR